MNLLKPAENSTIALSPDSRLGGAGTTVGVRPEDLHRAAGAIDAAFSAKMRIQAMELVGAESYVYALWRTDKPSSFEFQGGLGSQCTPNAWLPLPRGPAFLRRSTGTD